MTTCKFTASMLGLRILTGCGNRTGESEPACLVNPGAVATDAKAEVGKGARIRKGARFQIGCLGSLLGS